MLTRGHIGSGKNAVQRALFRKIPLGDDHLAVPQVNGLKAGSGPVEAIEVHYLDPRRHEISH